MFGRGRQLAVVAILLLAVGVVAIGCGLGGGGSSATTAVTFPSGTTVSLAPGATPQSQLIGTKFKPTKQSPADVAAAVQAGKPVVLLFYVAGGADDAQVLASLQALQPTFSTYQFGLYDYKTPDAYGDLSILLQVNYPPELILVDATGTIRQIWNGFVDAGTINQQLVNLGKG